MNLRRWLTIGIGVKRWLLVAFVGLVILALGLAHMLRQLTVYLEPGDPIGELVNALTFQFLPYQLRGILLGGAGVVLFLLGSYRLVRALVDPFALWDRDQPMVEVIYQKRFLARGPRIVAIGGGTGLSTLLRGLKEHTSNLTAVVTVADDGGSSGVLRAELGIPAVGDIRNCVVALADSEPLMGRLLQYRFPGAGPASASPTDPDKASAADAAAMPLDGPFAAAEAGLGGHALGNLLLAALVQFEQGDFEQGVREMNRVLAVRGSVVPATGTVLTMHARLRDGTEVAGQSRIAHTMGIEHVWVTPDDVHPPTTPCGPSPMPTSSCWGPGACTRACCPRCLSPASARRSPTRAPSSSSPATWPHRRARRTATTSRTISTRLRRTEPRTCPTSYSRTTVSTPALPQAGAASPSASAGRPAATPAPASSSTTS